MSWLVDYIKFTEGQESPEKFHFWSGIATIAGILGRNVYLDRRSRGVTRYTVYPGQLQITLVGASGRVKKNGALYQAKRFLNHCNIPLIGGKGSAEAFIDQMDPKKNGSPQAVLYETELTVLINNTAYAAPLVDILTKLADAEDPFVFATRGGGKIVIPKPCVTILAATTPTNLGKGMPPQAQETGFLSRGLYVYEKDTDRVESLTDVEDTDITPDELKIMQDLEQRLKDRAMDIKRLFGPFTFTPIGKEWFDRYYTNYVTSVEGKGEGYPTRRSDHLLRVAMVLQVTNSDDLILDQPVLQAADLSLKSIEVDFPKAFAYIGTLGVKDRERIIEAIVINGGSATANQIYNRVHRYFHDMDSIRRTMIMLSEAGMIMRTQERTDKQPEKWGLIRDS